MKTMNQILTLTAIILFAISPVFGNTPTLTEEQKLLLDAHMQQRGESFEAFRSSLDVFQLAIIENSEMRGHQKHQELQASLTLEQEALLEAHRIFDHIMKKDFRNTLTKEQRINIRETIKSSLNDEQVAIMEAEKVLREAQREEFSKGRTTNS